MRTGELRKVLDHLRHSGGGLTDGQLLARFLDGREEAAFAALVGRHGPMVLGVCRRVLRHAQDAEDAFQAAFLLLARKAASVARREALGGWLYRVAYRAALAARARAARRRERERQVEPMPQPEVTPPQADDWRPLLDRELDALPEKYRLAVLLCDLQGHTRREAARRLGLSEGTLSSQLTRGRRLLARRLARRGLTLSGGALAAALAAEAARAAVPARLAISTVKAAVLLAGGPTAAVATPAALLMNEVLKSMLMTKLKIGGAVVLAVVLFGAGGLLYRAAGQESPDPGVKPPSPAASKPLAGGPMTELELLRREVEILKLQMEVVQAELRTLKGRGAVGPGGATFRPDSPFERRPPGPGGRFSPPPATTAPPGGASTPAPGVQPRGLYDPASGAKQPPAETRSVVPPRPWSPETEVENALEAFREARDSGDVEATRRAAADLEKALHRFRAGAAPAAKEPPRKR
jgi:RNA polymerase sigma factor (sigma-70 family)